MKVARVIVIFATSLFIVALAMGQSVPKAVFVDASCFTHGAVPPVQATESVPSPMPLAFDGVRFDSPWLAYTGPLGYVFALYKGHSECAQVNYALGQWFVSIRGATAKPFGNLADAKAVADKGCKDHAGQG